jgi:hypothetical protein
MLNVSASFRWEPVALLVRSLILPEIDDAKLTSLSRQGVRISRPVMISTKTVISLPTLL